MVRLYSRVDFCHPQVVGYHSCRGEQAKLQRLKSEYEELRVKQRKLEGEQASNKRFVSELRTRMMRKQDEKNKILMVSAAHQLKLHRAADARLSPQRRKPGDEARLMSLFDYYFGRTNVC